MDIQSVIISFNELNSTKQAIANAIRAKGVSSQGRFASFANEINDIQTDSVAQQIKDVFEVVENNNVKVYSLYPIQNIEIADGPYKTRIKQNISSKTHPLNIDDNVNCGNLLYYKLSLSIEPKKEENTHGEVAIKYTTNNKTHSVQMTIQDLLDTSNDNVFVLKQLTCDLDNPNKDLQQTTNIRGEKDVNAMLNGKNNSIIKAYSTRPRIFDTLTNLSYPSGRSAVLMLTGNNGDKEYIPVIVYARYISETVDVGTNNNAAVIEIQNNDLFFHVTSVAGALSKRYTISIGNIYSYTAIELMNKVRKIHTQGNGIIGIAMKHDGSPITVEEAKDAGLV